MRTFMPEISTFPTIIILHGENSLHALLARPRDEFDQPGHERN